MLMWQASYCVAKVPAIGIETAYSLLMMIDYKHIVIYYVTRNDSNLIFRISIDDCLLLTTLRESHLLCKPI